MSKPHAVAVVADPEFGEKLIELAARIHVWVCDTPSNREVAQRTRVAGSEHDLERGTTTFQFDPSDPPDVVVSGILQAIDLHHGELSHTPPWSVLEIFGAELTDQLETSLREYGFSSFSPLSEGFRCTRNAA